MLEINNQEVSVSAQKEKTNDKKTELKIVEFNNTSVAISDQKEKEKITKNNTFANENLELDNRKEQAVGIIDQKEKINRVIHDDFPIDDPSWRFIFRDLGLQGRSFINSDLEFKGHHEFFNDNIIEFWIK